MMSLASYLHDTQWHDFPDAVRHNACRAIFDTIGVSVAASQTELSSIIRQHAARMFSGNSSSLWWDGRMVSPVGAALANAMTIDALDAHDGQKLTKGHIGCGLIPGILAIAEAEAIDNSQEIMTALVLGYEFGTRAGVSLHASAADYHTSGAWIAVTVAAIGARLLGCNETQTRHAMGIAEYHGPRSQMMRCIDTPSMVKDGSGWGAMAGVSAAYLAADGFTGAPAISIEGKDVAGYWADLGTHHYMNEQYIKLYPVCRWAQPAVEAVLDVMKQHDISSDQIASIEISSFDEAVRLCSMATNTEEAQYSLPFSVAVAALRGTIGVADISSAGLNDLAIQAMARQIRITPDDQCNAAFPQQRFAIAKIQTMDGSIFESAPTEAIGDPEDAVSDDILRQKFNNLAVSRLDDDMVRTLDKALGGLQQIPDIHHVMNIMRQH
ncbi:MAG: MmgE/PrpD family protein [Candidatus Puniceispirillales bacterium]